MENMNTSVNALSSVGKEKQTNKLHDSYKLSGQIVPVKRSIGIRSHQTP